jgi:hypothetical protein
MYALQQPTGGVNCSGLKQIHAVGLFKYSVVPRGDIGTGERMVWFIICSIFDEV